MDARTHALDKRTHARTHVDTHARILLDQWHTDWRINWQRMLWTVLQNARTHPLYEELSPLLRKTMHRYSWYTDQKIHQLLTGYIGHTTIGEHMDTKIFLKLTRPSRYGEVSVTWPVDADTDETTNLDNIDRITKRINSWADTLGTDAGAADSPEGGASSKTVKASAAKKPASKTSSLPARPGAAKKTAAKATASKPTASKASALPARPGAAKKPASNGVAALRRGTSAPPPLPPSKVDRAVADEWLGRFAASVEELRPDLAAMDDDAYNEVVMDTLTKLSNMTYDEICGLSPDHFTTTTAAVDAALVL